MWDALGELVASMAACVPAEPAQEQQPPQVVDLVLQAAGEQAISFEPDGTPGPVLPVHGGPFGAGVG